MRYDAVRSHHSAAVVWDLWLVCAPLRPHVTVPRNASRRIVAGARIHRADLPDTDVVLVDDEPVTTPLRTVVDLARGLPLPEALAVVDSALRLRRVTRTALGLRAGRARGPGAGRLGRAVVLANPLSESFLESYCRGVLIAAGLAPECLQHVVRDEAGRQIGRVDLAWPSRRLLVEVDGFAFHADRQRYREDRRRHNALELAGWRVLRFSWEDIVSNPAYVVASVGAALSLAA